ncbi:Histone acetyltransferase type B catalytic subunit [Entamoeba marina]
MDKDLLNEVVAEVMADPLLMDKDPLKGKNKDFICSAADSIGLYFVSSRGDVEKALNDKYLENCTDYPDFVHQLFLGDSEIYGYKDLRIHVLISVYSHLPYVSVHYEQKIDDAEDIVKCLTKFLPKHQHLLNREEYCENLEKERYTVKPVGEMIHEFQEKGETYQIYYGKSENLFVFYSQLFLLISMYIERANLVNVEGKWEFFFVYQVIDNPTDITKREYRIAAHTNVYRFYHYPDLWRLRIGQFISFPNYQRKGLGRFLLRRVYSFVVEDGCYDLTVEDACLEFQKLRTMVELKMLEEFDMKLPINVENETLTECPPIFGITKIEMMNLYEMMVWAEVRKNDDVLPKVELELKQKYYTQTKTELELLDNDQLRLEMIDRAIQAKIAHFKLIYSVLQ